MKKTILFGAILIGSLASAQMRMGGGTDSFGCPSDGGYSYSVILNDCIQIFNQKIIMKQVGAPQGQPISKTCVIFSKNKKQAETFLPGQKQSIILRKMGNYWTNGIYQLIPTANGGYALKQDGDVIFQSNI
ncbi:hypothetical protein SAMN05421841_0901 [Chryseobacterium wanjuense]|jgi:hypothetical protein|uniref:Uncharacterized protein n=1 Tax=Chryseobacterium wanjuense TaxID=356305 RepID=A0A1I0P034_9FLAO|nr:hypothetical protein [Chryseobacterium wanjuense]SEW07314.1 hypothetical protein SAMN05421841_0901 [Chryseobacterium wanjuense]